MRKALFSLKKQSWFDKMWRHIVCSKLTDHFVCRTICCAFALKDNILKSMWITLSQCTFSFKTHFIVAKGAFTRSAQCATCIKLSNIHKVDA